MKFDEILTHIGEFGSYQKRIYLLLSFPCVFIGGFCMMLIVLLYTPEHRCKIPSLHNDTYAVQSEAHEILIHETIPPSADPLKIYDTCHMYDRSHLNETQRTNDTRKVKCNEWVYDRTVFKETFTSKIDLVCGDSLKTSHIMMFFYFGLLVGDIVLGMMSDALGRKTSMYIGLVLMFVSSVTVSFVPEFFSFSVLQFIIGGSAHGGFVALAVLSMEMVGLTKRKYTGMLIQVFFAVGICYVAFMGFLIRSWTWINLSVAVPCVFFLSYWWFIPESPRWLLSKGRENKAVSIIKKTAKVNKAHVPDHLFDVHKHDDSTDSLQGNIWHLLSSPILRRRTLILSFNWMVVSMTYYGVTMNSGNMGGNFFLNFFLMGLAEIPGTLIGMAILDRIGRRWSNGGMMILGGVACVAAIPTVVFGGTNLQPLTITLALIGKGMASGAFAIVYMFTAELSPTVVRNAAMGWCSMSARVGGMLAPYVAKSGNLFTGKISIVAPLVLFGVFSILAGLLLFLLPETLNQKLPDTIEEGERFGRKTSVADVETELPFMATENNASST